MHKNWLNNVCKTAKREALCKCHGRLLLFSLPKEHQTMFCIWAQPDLWNETENCILKIQELLFNSLCKHSQPVFAVCPELHLSYSQFFVLYLGILCYVLVLLPAVKEVGQYYQFVANFYGFFLIFPQLKYLYFWSHWEEYITSADSWKTHACRSPW